MPRKFSGFFQNRAFGKISTCLVSFALMSGPVIAKGSAQERLDYVLALVTNEGASSQEQSVSVEAYLISLPPNEAIETSASLLKLAREKRLISRTEFAKQMLSAHLLYMPNAEIAIDHWRYIAMISAKQDRNEISLEEYEYLEAKHRKEALKNQRAVEQVEADLQLVESARKRMWAEEDRRAANEALAEAIGGIGHALQRAYRPPVRCTSTRNGINVDTICR